MKLFLKGERCYTEKCAIEKRNVPPGQHGQLRKAKMVGYGLQLREKQKVKRIYGVLENQFRRYFEAADRQTGITGEMLLQMLERRLDNVVYRLGLRDVAARRRASSCATATSLVNGRKVDIPSYSVQAGRHRRACAATQRAEPDDPARDGRSEGPRHSRVAARSTPATLSRPHRLAADARADQPARAGAADRRVVFEVSCRAPSSRRSAR